MSTGTVRVADGFLSIASHPSTGNYTLTLDVPVDPATNGLVIAVSNGGVNPGTPLAAIAADGRTVGVTCIAMPDGTHPNPFLADFNFTVLVFRKG